MSVSGMKKEYLLSYFAPPLDGCLARLTVNSRAVAEGEPILDGILITNTEE